MKKVITLCLIIFSAFLLNAQNLLNQPQKIVVDGAHNRYLVSNFAGGWPIVQIDSLGNQSYFLETTEFNDGMEIVGNVVYGSSKYSGWVAGYDLDSKELVFELNTGDSGVIHLSSFVVDTMGILYTSERFGTRIFKINPETGDYWVFAEGGGIDQANGLLYEPEFNRMLVLNDAPNPPIHSINLTDSTVSVLANTTLDGSDGIAKDMYGNYYITGYELDGIYKFSPDFSGEPELFFEGTTIIYPTYHEEHGSLLVTFYNQSEWGEIPVLFSAHNEIDFKKTFELEQSFPNPFRDNTTINFSLDKDAITKLDILNIEGKIINTLLNEKKQKGNYSMKWNGKSFSGKSVAQGKYFYKLSVNGHSKTRKILKFD